MAKTDLKLYATDPYGKQTTASITYVNPEASNTQLKTLGQMLNALTQNVYESTYRVNTIHCDSEAGRDKQTATITLDKTTDTYTNVKATATTDTHDFIRYQLTITYDGDGDIFSNVKAGSSAVTNAHQFAVTTNPFINGQGQKLVWIKGVYVPEHQSIAGDIIITFRAEETDNFKAATATFTITP